MKKNFFFFVFVLSISLIAQDYTPTDGLYGSELQKTLFNLIKNHTRYPYSSSSTDTWDILKEADKDPNNPNNIITIYMGYSLDADGEYSAGWNREHVWAKSHGFPNSGDTAYTDCHHLHPADISTNSARGNKDFDNGGQEYLDGGTVHSGCYYTNISWEPRDAVKGDVARSMLYMATRYNSPALNLQLVENIPTSSNTPYFGKLSTLLAWNRFDPPDDWERRRNNVVESFQHNRNPFIDHPEFADRIYIADSLVIEYAKMVGPDKFVIKFSEDVNSTSANNAENYSLVNSNLQITSAQTGYQGDNSIVKLTVNANLTDSVYIARVSNVESTSGKKITYMAIAVFAFDPNVDVEEDDFPTEFSLNQNYPNPFNPTTTITYVIARSGATKIRLGRTTGNSALTNNSIDCHVNSNKLEFTRNDGIIHVSLKVYDALGREVATLVNEEQTPGKYAVQFNANSAAGGLPSGIYFYTLRAGNFGSTKKMILLK